METFMINGKSLEKQLGELLDIFYAKRKGKLKELQLIPTLKRKNPYLYRATGVSTGSEIIKQVMAAFISSSDETIFGNEFFEPLAKWAAAESAKNRKRTTVTVGAAAGVDIAVEDAICYIALAVKSGTKVFNAQSRSQQETEFQALRSRLSKIKKQFRSIVGYGYGRKVKRVSVARNFEEVAGQDFWELVTGEADFYLRIMKFMEEKPKEHAVEFKEELAKTENRLVKEFLFHFSNDDGSIDWEKLTKFNSGTEPMKLEKISVNDE
jgi:hypothetical protein